MPACTAAGVWVSIVPDLLTAPTAELAIGLAIGAARHLRAGDALVRGGAFEGWRPRLYGRGLQDAVVAVVGLGRVGAAIVQRLAGFGCARTVGVDPAVQLPGVPTVSLAEALAEADFMFVAAPLVPGSRHAIDAAALSGAKRQPVLVNVGRGSVVDEEAVADALRDAPSAPMPQTSSPSRTGASPTDHATCRSAFAITPLRCSRLIWAPPCTGCGWRSSTAPRTT